MPTNYSYSLYQQPTYSYTTTTPMYVNVGSTSMSVDIAPSVVAVEKPKAEEPFAWLDREVDKVCELAR